MAEVAAVSAIFGLVTGSIDVIKICITIYKDVQDKTKLPKRLRLVAEQLPSIQQILLSAQDNQNQLHHSRWIEAKSDLERCHESCEALTKLFEEAFPKQDAGKFGRLITAAATVLHSKGQKAEKILRQIKSALDNLTTQDVITNTKLLDEITLVLADMQKDNNEGLPSQESGTQNNNMGGTGHFTTINNEASGNARQFNGPVGNFFEGTNPK